MELHITRFGSKIAVKDGLFEITWFDDQQMLQREAHSPLNVKSIWVQDGTLISVTAHLLAMQHGINLVMMDHHGMPQAQCYGYELHNTPMVQKAQVIVSVSNQAIPFVRTWVSTKMQNQSDFLEKLKSRRDAQKQALLDAKSKEIIKLRKQVLLLEGKNMADIAERLRGLEGAASAAYFQTLSDVLPTEYRFDGRSRQPARDPYIGFFHRDGHRLKSMVYDFVEPYRIWIEKVVFRLFSRKMVAANHTEVRDGGTYLNKEGRKLLIANLREYLDEKKEELDGNLVSRERFLRQTASRFAVRIGQLAIIAKGLEFPEA
jgi:CRISPR-associated protein Cas1